MKMQAFVIALLGAAAQIPLAGAAFAQGDTRTIQVTANVKGSCKFDATPNINFGDLDPSAPADKTQQIDVSFKCTKGLQYTLTVGDGQNLSGGKNRMRGASGGDFIAYDVAPKTQGGNGTGFNSAITIKITGTVRAVDYQNVSAGAYADTVTLSVQP